MNDLNSQMESEGLKPKKPQPVLMEQEDPDFDPSAANPKVRSFQFPLDSQGSQFREIGVGD